MRPCSPSCPRSPTRSRPGTPVVALESTIISHGLPRPENLRVAREIEQAVRRGGAVPATIALVDGRPCIGLDDHALEQVATRDDVVKVSTRDLATLAARRGTGATTVAATSHLAARAGITVFATGGLGGVHRDARSTWDESADLQRPRDHRHHDRLRRREVDPRRARHPRAARDPRRTRPRLRHDGVPRLLPQRLRPPRRLAGRQPRGGRRRDGAAGRARHRRPRRRRGQPAAADRAGRPGPARPAAARRAGGSRDSPGPRQGRSRRSSSSSSTARARASRSRRTSASSCATPSWPPGSPPRPPGSGDGTVPLGTETLDVVVVGDVMVDVLAAMSGPLARGSDTPATVTTAGGGSGANVAAWLAGQGVPTAYVGRVGDDALGRESVAALTDRGVTAWVSTDPERTTGHLHRARRARRRTVDAARRRREREPRTGTPAATAVPARRPPAPVRLHAAQPAARARPDSPPCRWRQQPT